METPQPVSLGGAVHLIDTCMGGYDGITADDYGGIAGALLGASDLAGLITTLRSLPNEQLDEICLALNLRR